MNEIIEVDSSTIPSFKRPDVFFYGALWTVIVAFFFLVLGWITSPSKMKPIEECGMTWEEVRVEDEFCAIWFEGDKQVIGPLWLKD